MSSFKHPVGSRPPGVYWRRRLIVLAIAIALVVLIIVFFVRLNSHHSSQVASHSTAPAVSTPASTPAETTAIAACTSSDVTVQAITDQAAYAAGQLPELSLSMTNSGSRPCSIDAGTAHQVFTISSGSETYWTSTDCQANASDATITLQPGKTVTSQSPITWDRTQSRPSTCNSARPPVPAAGASYHLTVSVDGITSAKSKQFILE